MRFRGPGQREASGVGSPTQQSNASRGGGVPWSRSPSDIDAYLAKLRAETRQSRINRGADPETGIKIVALRSDLAPEQRPEALRIGRIGFASAGAKRKPKEAIAA